VNKIEGMRRMRRRREKRKPNMTTNLARMAEVLRRSPSTRKIGTTAELNQNVVARVTKTAVPGGGRRRRGKGGRRRRRQEWCSGRRKAKGVKGPRAVTPEERTPGGQILYSEARRVKLDGTRVVSSKLTNRKKVINHPRSNKDIGKAKKTRSRTHGGDRKARPITNHDERRTRGCGGRTEERIPTSGVVWKEAPESAIHSVLTGGVRPMALKDCANAAWSHPPGQVGGWLG